MFLMFFAFLFVMFLWSNSSLKEKPRQKIVRDPRSGQRRRITYYSTDLDEIWDNHED